MNSCSWRAVVAVSSIRAFLLAVRAKEMTTAMTPLKKMTLTAMVMSASAKVKPRARWRGLADGALLRRNNMVRVAYGARGLSNRSSAECSYFA